jgi:hypothetical protein
MIRFLGHKDKESKTKKPPRGVAFEYSIGFNYCLTTLNVCTESAAVMRIM